MTSPRKLLEAKGIHPRKSMGQHFLADPNIAASILTKARFAAHDIVFEIGAGLGALTLPLAARVKHVFALEPDSRIAALLGEELLAANVSNVTVIEEDILQCDLEAFTNSPNKNLKVIGNLPYHISSQVLLRLIRFRHLIDAAFLMFQKEVAERLTAVPGTKDYGRPSVAIQYCATITPLISVGASAFFPRPKVDSQVVAIAFHHPVSWPATDEDFFFSVVKAAFGKRRKTLKNALLGGGLGLKDELLSAALKLTGIDPRRRAETLTVNEFVALSNLLHQAKRSQQ